MDDVLAARYSTLPKHRLNIRRYILIHKLSLSLSLKGSPPLSLSLSLSLSYTLARSRSLSLPLIHTNTHSLSLSLPLSPSSLSLPRPRGKLTSDERIVVHRVQKVNLPHVFHFRAVCGAKLVT